MNPILTYGFLQRALLAGVFIAVACAVLGVFLILRRDAMIGHGLSHVTFGGVALGLLLNLLPLLVALLAAVFCALAILKLREKAGVYEDTAIGIFSSVGMAVGIVLAGLAGSFNVGLLSYLFGNVLAIDPLEVWVAVALAVAVLSIVALFYQEFLFLTFDPESARTAGVNVHGLDRVLAVLTAVTVVLGMKVVGLLLVAALLVIPSAAGLQVAKNFRQAIIVSSVAGAASVLGGLAAAFYWDLPPSGSIVLLAAALFVALLAVRVARSTP